MNEYVENPGYKLRIDTFGLRYYLIVNGIVVMQQLSSDSQLTTSIPVSHWMAPDANEFTLEVYPDSDTGRFKSGARFSLSLEVIDRDSRDEFSIPVLSFSGVNAINELPSIGGSKPGKYTLSDGLIANSDGYIKIADGHIASIEDVDGAFSLGREIILPSRTPRWRFLQSELLPDYYGMDDEAYYSALDELYDFYEILQKEFEKGDVNNIVSLFSERSSEMDEAYDLPSGTTQQNLFASIKEDIDSPNVSLSRFTKDMLVISPERNNLLVSLTRNNEAPALAFESSSGTTYYDFKLRREKGKWIITR